MGYVLQGQGQGFDLKTVHLEGFFGGFEESGGVLWRHKNAPQKGA